MHRSSKVHFLTAYVEYLMNKGIRSEEYYVGDASRFIRFLLANITENDVRDFKPVSQNAFLSKPASENSAQILSFRQRNAGFGQFGTDIKKN